LSVSIPTVAEIKAQIITDIETSIGATIPIMPKAFVRVLATALAGVIHLAYRFGLWVYKQIFAATADIEALISKAAEYGMTRNAAISAILTATVTGTTGITIPAGTLWSTAAGVVYEQEDAITLTAGTGTITIAALTGGIIGNLANGLLVTLASPISGVDADATIASTVTTGEDAEAVEDFRTRLVERIRFRPGVGTAVDYIRWAREVTGIVKAFAFNTAPGQVTVYPLLAITGASRIPAAGKITEVQDYLNVVTRKPLGAEVLAAAMTEIPVDLELSALVPDSAGLRTEIEDAIEAYLYTRYPRQYTDEVATNIVSLASLYGVASDTGAQSITIASSSMGAGLTLDDDEIVTLGTVTWS